MTTETPKKRGKAATTTATPEAVTAAPEPVAAPEAETAAPEPVAAPEAETAAPEPVAAPEAETAAPEPVAAPEAETAAPEPVANVNPLIMTIINNGAPYYELSLKRHIQSGAHSVEFVSLRQKRIVLKNLAQLNALQGGGRFAYDIKE